MDYGRFAERTMAMDDTAWHRHANPWSVWTRVPILPLLVFFLYARLWFGWWVLAPVALLIMWAFINPRAFPKPRTMTTWSARGTMGERVWLARKTHPIPAEFARAAHVLSAAGAVGVAILAYGLVVLNPWASLAGTILTLGAKMWFVDRMVWLYDVAGHGRFQQAADPQQAEPGPHSGSVPAHDAPRAIP